MNCKKLFKKLPLFISALVLCLSILVQGSLTVMATEESLTLDDVSDSKEDAAVDEGILSGGGYNFR